MKKNIVKKKIWKEDIIQGLWIGNKLSLIELLSLHSFLKYGHTYHLYIYEPIENIPEGIIIKDANEIIELHENLSKNWFSDMFRYKLLYDKGGIWVDLDVVCLQKFQFEEDYIFAGQKYPERHSICGNVLKAPKGSPLMWQFYNFCLKNRKNTYFGQVGPELLTRTLKDKKYA